MSGHVPRFDMNDDVAQRLVIGLISDCQETSVFYACAMSATAQNTLAVSCSYPNQTASLGDCPSHQGHT